MSDHPLKALMDSALEGLRSIADVNTIIGEPVEAPDGTVIIPVSKVSMGFGMGGSDIKGVSYSAEGSNLFGGGGGGGVNIQPIAFLVIGYGDVKLLTIDKGIDFNLAEAIPSVVNFATSLFKKKDKAEGKEEKKEK